MEKETITVAIKLQDGWLICPVETTPGVIPLYIEMPWGDYVYFFKKGNNTRAPMYKEDYS